LNIACGAPSNGTSRAESKPQPKEQSKVKKRNHRPLDMRSIPVDDVTVIHARLQAALGVAVGITRIVTDSGPTNWYQLSCHIKHHAAAKLYIDAWLQGRRDGLDAHYDRPGYRAQFPRVSNGDQLAV